MSEERIAALEAQIRDLELEAAVLMQLVVAALVVSPDRSVEEWASAWRAAFSVAQTRWPEVSADDIERVRTSIIGGLSGLRYRDGL